MTKEEAIEQLKFDIEMIKFNPSTGEEAYLNEESKKTIEAIKLAIEALKRDDPEVEFQKRFERSTYCGYTLKELLMFADACKRQGITEEHLHIFWKNAEGAYNYIVQIIKEGVTKSIERTLS